MLESLQLDISGRETKDGLSWLELKNHMLLSYLIDINDVVQSKLKGGYTQFSIINVSVF